MLQDTDEDDVNGSLGAADDDDQGEVDEDSDDDPGDDSDEDSDEVCHPSLDVIDSEGVSLVDSHGRWKRPCSQTNGRRELLRLAPAAGPGES
jgi:hypothetical protein